MGGKSFFLCTHNRGRRIWKALVPRDRVEFSIRSREVSPVIGRHNPEGDVDLAELFHAVV